VNEPVVGIAEDERAGTPLVERGFDVRLQLLGLLRLAELLHRVDAVLAEHQRQFARDVLEPRQVAAEDGGFVQVHVEANEVDVAGLEVFGGREVRERDEAIWRLRLGHRHQFVDELLDLLGAAEPHDVRRDFVDDADGEHRRVVAAGAGAVAHRLVRLPRHLRVADEREVLGPGDVQEDLQPELLGHVQEPLRRHVVDADAVGAEGGELLEVPPDLVALRQRQPFTAGGEGAVGDALDVELLGPQAEELAVPPDPVRHRLGASLPARRLVRLRRRVHHRHRGAQPGRRHGQRGNRTLDKSQRHLTSLCTLSQSDSRLICNEKTLGARRPCVIGRQNPCPDVPRPGTEALCKAVYRPAVGKILTTHANG
jgi:hypothetical protein